jgi:hypothetical protein
MKSTISKSKTNLKMSEVPVTAISHQSQKNRYFSLKRCIVNSHHPYKFPHISLKQRTICASPLEGVGEVYAAAYWMKWTMAFEASEGLKGEPIGVLGG